MFKNKHIINSSFTTDLVTCPIPKVSNNITSLDEIPIKILFKNNNDTLSPFNKIKREVDKFVATNTNHHTSFKAPAVVNIPEHKTVASDTKSSKCIVMNKRLTAFLQILFAKPGFNNNGDMCFLEPAIISDSLQEILTATSKTSQQARMVSDAMKVLSDEIADKNIILAEI